MSQRQTEIETHCDPRIRKTIARRENGWRGTRRRVAWDEGHRTREERQGKRECTSLPRSHVLYKTRSLHGSRRRRNGDESVRVCTLARRRSGKGRGDRETRSEHMLPFAIWRWGTSPADKPPTEMSLFSPISLAAMSARPPSLLRNFRFVLLTFPPPPVLLLLSFSSHFISLSSRESRFFRSSLRVPVTNDLPIDTV